MRQQRDAGQPQRQQPPQEDADIGDVVAPAAAAFLRFRTAHLDRVRHGVEGAAARAHCRLRAQVGGGPGVRAQVLHVLGGGELLEELGHVRRPVGQVARQLLQHQRGALAAAVGDGVGDLGARRSHRGTRATQRSVPDQVADVGRDPVRAGFDELVVVELLDVLFQRFEFAREQGEQRVQRTTLFLVADALDRGQQRVQALHLQTHGITSRRSSGPGCRDSNSAGNGTPSTTRMRDASRRVCAEGSVCA